MQMKCLHKLLVSVFSTFMCIEMHEQPKHRFSILLVLLL